MPTAPDSLCIDPAGIEPFVRGEGVVTLPYVGSWNSDTTSVTTGVTIFAAGTSIPLHTHNVEETVLVLSGEAMVTIGEEELPVGAGWATWVPAGVQHRFVNRGRGEMRIYWVYGGRHVTRTICATGETVEHLSMGDRLPGRVEG